MEVVRRAYEAFNRGDIDGALAVLPSTSVHHVRCDPRCFGDLRGPEGFKRFVGSLLEQFDDVQFEINDVIGHDDDQLVFRHTNRGRGKRSGAETSWDVWQVVRFRDGKAVRAHAFTTKEEALEAAGLSE